MMMPKADSPHFTGGGSAWPGPRAVTTPLQSRPGGPGSPGYRPMTFSTSRKFMPMAPMRTSASPSTGGLRCTSGCMERLLKLPRLGMCRYGGHIGVRRLCTSRGARTRPPRTLASASSAAAGTGGPVASGALRPSKSRHCRKRSGNSSRAERAKAQRPAWVGSWWSQERPGGCALTVARTRGGASGPRGAAACTRRRAPSRASSCPPATW
mmetsp:Transcript_101014/g.281379  ORF Transcript_101014/g.281379 Transcript_101014/m.281379 type:complete len:210 (-) Transcript_101014:379-1008(-)